MNINSDNLKHLTLNRTSTSDQGTIGQLFDNGQFKKWVIELPWKDNTPNISCIPHGNYIAVPHRYRGRINSFRLLDVPNRSSVLIHNGNFAGDKTLNYKTHSAGCLIIGSYIGYIKKQIAVLSSRVALRGLVNYIDNCQFLLSIRETINISKSKTFYKGETS